MGRVVRYAQSTAFCAAILLIVAGAMRAQDALSVPVSKNASRLGGPQDWSTKHTIYTLNGSAEDMLKLRDDPRFMHNILLHYLREHRNQAGLPGTAGFNESGWIPSNLTEEPTDPNTRNLRPPDPLDLFDPIKFLPTVPLRNMRSKVDWAFSLGPTAGMSLGETPGVYTYNYAVPSCSTLSATPPVVGDFVVYTVDAAPSTGIPGQANLVALTNLYTAGDGTGFCPGTGPSVLFSYAIGTGASPLSPVISLDGTKVAWIENRTATTSYLHITNWVANQGTSATAPATVNGTFLNGSCTTAGTSCDDAIAYTASVYPGCPTAFTAGNGHSELYVDYGSNAGYISANNGLLYHIKNIFSSTISPSVDFCIPVNATFETTPSSAMSGPVYDSLINKVFITDSEKIYSYNVSATSSPSFSLAGSFTYGNNASNHNYQTGPGPLLDAFNNFIYVFSTYDSSGRTSVTQLPTSLASSVQVPLGNRTTNANHFLFYGAFDHNYFTNGPKSAASTLYSCGTDSTTRTAQDLFAISFNPTTGLANTTPAMSTNKNVNPGGQNGVCSPLTEFFDGTTDRLFVGMGMPGATSGANVVTMWNITHQLTSATTTPTVTTPTAYLGGTSGISADNNASGVAQAQSIYFSTEEVGTASTPVPATTAYNVNGIYTDGTTFPANGGLDQDGNAYSSTLLGTTQTWNGTSFTFGPANAVDAWQNKTITLPAGSFSTMTFLAAAVNGNLPSQTFVVTYTDNSTTTVTQSVSDWFTPQNYPGESIAVSTAYRNESNGAKDRRTFDLYGYSFSINAKKTVKSLTLPPPSNVNGANDNVVVVLAVSLSSNCGGQDYCAVKLTQSGLQ
jgi:hypothetical protein